MKIAALNAQLPAFVHDATMLPLAKRAPLMATLAKARGWDVVCLQEVDAAALNTIRQAFGAGWVSVIEPVGLNGFLLRTGIGAVLRDQTWKLDSYGQRQRTLALLTLQTTLGTVACGSSHFAAAGPDISEAQANAAKLAQCAQVRALLPQSGPVILGLDFARADADDDEAAWRDQGYELGDRIVGKGEPTPETVITRGLPVLARTVVPTGQACDHDAMEIGIGDQMSYLTGKDVSSAQGTGWAASKSDVFTFIKATEGKSYVSPTLQAQTASARAAGHVVGFYHFLWPVATSGSTATQAAWFVTNAAAQAGDLLVCDWEGTKGGTAPAAETVAFLAEVRRLAPQCKVGLYVNASMWKSAPQSLRDAAVAKGGFLWLAEYAKSPSVTGWSFWQYADHAGSVKVDQNYVNATSVGYFRKWARELVPAVPTPAPTKPATPAPAPKPDSKPVSPLVAIVEGIRTEADQLAAYVTGLRATAAELEKQIPA